MLSVHKGTVRLWIKQGLSVIDDLRLMLILGSDLVTFLKKKRAKNKHPCKPGEIYCVKCCVPKSPAGNMADYMGQTETLGNLIGVCPDCENVIYRCINPAKIDKVSGQLDVTFTKA